MMLPASGEFSPLPSVLQAQVIEGLRTLPLARPVMVNHARTLRACEAYPPPAISRKLARLIVESPDLCEGMDER